MDHGTRDLGTARLAAAGVIATVTDTEALIKPVPRKKGPIKKPPNKPMPMPDAG